MQVKKINAYLDAFEAYLQEEEGDERIYVWESQRRWQENWDLAATDLAEMYRQSLQNSTTRRMWNRESYEPKKIMLRFARLQPEYFRQMFNDLLNENKEVSGRLSRFTYYCDQLLEMLREKHPKRAFPSHFHDDGYEISSIYLSFQYPEEYIPYRLTLFQSVMKKLGAPKPVLAHDTERYFKVSKTLDNMLQKRETLLEKHQQRLKEGIHYMEKSRLLVYDLLCFIQTTDLSEDGQ
ncbi:MAG TPA: hypothetical protein VJ953_09895 [Saprospiraceae bacterium]|nr:hypothetical protein [Saprospiraceae bacterium]